MIILLEKQNKFETNFQLSFNNVCTKKNKGKIANWECKLEICRKVYLLPGLHSYEQE